MRYFLTLLLLLATMPALAQNNAISINAQGAVQLKADIIQFQINLNARGGSPQAAYDLHKQREKTLVRLLERYNIEEKDIRFEPVSIARHSQYDREAGREADYFQTQQSVSLTLKDFSVYEQMQVRLIAEGFDNFNGNFTSTEMEEGKNEALRKAIRNARAKAELIAEEAGLILSSIKNISWSDHNVQPYYNRAAEMSQSADASLLQYEQQVTVTTTVSVEFSFLVDGGR